MGAKWAKFSQKYKCVAYNAIANTENVCGPPFRGVDFMLPFWVDICVGSTDSPGEQPLWYMTMRSSWVVMMMAIFWFDSGLTEHFAYVISLPHLILAALRWWAIMTVITPSSTIIRNYFFIYVRRLNSGPCYVARLVYHSLCSFELNPPASASLLLGL